MSTYSIISYPAKDLPANYQALIFAQWLRTLRKGNDHMKLIDSDAYYKNFHKYIERVLSVPEAVVRLAVLTDDQDIVLGFSVSREAVLDYVYVHKDNRRLGIGKSLVPEGITTITYLTFTGITIWANKYSKWKCNPFI